MDQFWFGELCQFVQRDGAEVDQFRFQLRRFVTAHLDTPPSPAVRPRE
jgi:hypothetical protein